MDFESIEGLSDKDIMILYDGVVQNGLNDGNELLAAWTDICCCDSKRTSSCNGAFCHPGGYIRWFASLGTSETDRGSYYSTVSGSSYTGYRWCEGHGFRSCGSIAYTAGNC